MFQVDLVQKKYKKKSTSGIDKIIMGLDNKYGRTKCRTCFYSLKDSENKIFVL